MNQFFYQRPQIKLTDFNLRWKTSSSLTRGIDVRILLKDPRNEGIQTKRVSVDKLHHSGHALVLALIRQGLIQNVCGNGYRSERGLQIMDDEGQMLLALLLDFESLFLTVCLNRDRNGFVQDAVDNRIDLSRDADAVSFRELLNRFSQGVVFRNKFDQIEILMEPRQAVICGAPVNLQCDHWPRLFLYQCLGYFAQQHAYVIIQRRGIQMPGCRDLPRLISPQAHEVLLPSPNNLCQFPEIRVAHDL